MKEISNLIREYFGDRINNPFSIAFCISWSLWNYKFLMIVFSKNTVSQTILLINQLYPTYKEYFIYFLVYPVLSSLFYLLVYPQLSKKIYEYHLEQLNKINEIKLKVEGKRIVTIETLQSIRQKHTEEVKALQEQIRILIEENSTIQNEVNSNDNQNKNEEVNSINFKKRDKLEIESIGFLFKIVTYLNGRTFLKDSEVLEFEKEIIPTKKQAYFAFLMQKDYLKRHSMRSKDGRVIYGYIVNPSGFIAAEKFSENII